jgi:subfamily B ATP-binding cassette protein MsbA
MFVFYLNPMFAFIALVVAPLVLLPVIQLGKRLRKTSRVSQERMEGLTTRLHETFSGIRIVKAFCAEDKEKARFKRENEKLLDVILRGVKYYSLTAPAMEIIGACAVAYMIFWGSSQIAEGNTTVGDFGMILAALYGMYNPIKKLSRINNDLQQAFAAVDRVYEVLATADEIEEKPDAVAMPELKNDIVFENVYFSYGEREILFDVNCTVGKGQVCAIVGLSGAGKTTMVNLLPRFDEVTEGRITIDGRDIRDFTLSSLRGNIGIVTQDTILFNDTVRSNIAYGMTDTIGQDDIESAAKAAFAHDFIMDMPEGYDTIIGEKGVRLSGGERQRLAIARALIKNPPILILDEATSSLDSESERLVQGALENLMAERTTFIIAHRLSTVRKADMILVIDSGRVVERGTHEELLEKGGMYKKLHTLQFADVSASQLRQGSPEVRT